MSEMVSWLTTPSNLSSMSSTSSKSVPRISGFSAKFRQSVVNVLEVVSKPAAMKAIP